MLQYDNCGENKNKYLFGYLSLLVQLQYFKEISLNFLIVGHTHCILDQYFSTLSTKINSCNFIGSPFALAGLFETDKSNGKSSFKNPVKQRFISVIYDVAQALLPYLNNTMKFYQVSK
jgi:hypothetical protein